MLTLATTTLLLARGDEGVAVAFFVITGIVAIVSTVSWNRRKAQQAAYNARLKQMMIERGMNANEIDIVIRAEPNGKRTPGAEYAARDPQRNW